MVGEGATALRLTRNVTLTALNGDVATLAVSQSMTSAAAAARAPGQGKGGGFTGEAKGTVAFDLRRPLPISGELAIETRTRHAAGAGREGEREGDWLLHTRIQATLTTR